MAELLLGQLAGGGLSAAEDEGVAVVPGGEIRLDPLPYVDAEEKLQRLIRRELQRSGPAPPYVCGDNLKRRVRRLPRAARGLHERPQAREMRFPERDGGRNQRLVGEPRHEPAEIRDAVELRRRRRGQFLVLAAAGRRGQKVPVPDRSGFQLGRAAASAGGQLSERVEKLSAADAVADTMVKPNPKRRRSIVEPRQLDNQRRRSVENVLNRKRQKPPPLGDEPGRAVEVRRGVVIRNGLNEERPLRATHNLQTRPVWALPDPTREREVQNESLGEGGFKAGGDGGCVDVAWRSVDEEILDGEAEEELRIEVGEREDTRRGGSGGGEEDGFFNDDGIGSHWREKRERERRDGSWVSEGCHFEDDMEKRDQNGN